MPKYDVNEEAVEHARKLIDAKRYVVRSRWQDAQPRTAERKPWWSRCLGMLLHSHSQTMPFRMTGCMPCCLRSTRSGAASMSTTVHNRTKRHSAPTAGSRRTT
jgi:hypothetical protein